MFKYVFCRFSCFTTLRPLINLLPQSSSPLSPLNDSVAIASHFSPPPTSSSLIAETETDCRQFLPAKPSC